MKLLRNDASIALVGGNRPFRWFWTGQSLAAVGAQVTAIALPMVTAIALDAGPAAVGFVATAGWLPYLVFSLAAGYALEGRDLRRFMILGEAIQIVSLASIPVLWSAGGLSVPTLAVAAFVAGCGALLVGLGGFTFVTELVPSEHLGAANRALQGTRTIAQVGGPGIAGLLVGAVGAPLAVVVDGIGHALSLVGLARARPDGPLAEPPARGLGVRGLLEGARVLARDARLRALTLHAAIYNMTAQIFVLDLVVYCLRVQHLSPAVYGLAVGMSGVGALVGTAVALRVARRWGFGASFSASLVLSCGTPIVIPLSPWHGPGFAVLLGGAFFVAGLGLGNANIYSLTLRQTLIPRGTMSRSAGAYTQVMYGAIPIGSALAGVIGGQLGSRTAVLIGAGGYIVSAIPVVAGRVGRMRRIEADERADRPRPGRAP